MIRSRHFLMMADLLSGKSFSRLICTHVFRFQIPWRPKAQNPLETQNLEPTIKGALIDKTAVNCQGKNVRKPCINCPRFSHNHLKIQNYWPSMRMRKKSHARCTVGLFSRIHWKMIGTRFNENAPWSVYASTTLEAVRYAAVHSYGKQTICGWIL